MMADLDSRKILQFIIRHYCTSTRSIRCVWWIISTLLRNTQPNGVTQKLNVRFNEGNVYGAIYISQMTTVSLHLFPFHSPLYTVRHSKRDFELTTVEP